MGVVSLPSDRSARSQTSPGRVSERQFCRFWGLVGGAPKERREPRDSDALMRVAAPRRRGPAGLRDLFRFYRNCGLYILRSGPFRVCEARGGITTLGAFHTVRKPCVAGYQNGVLCRFWVLPGVRSRRTQRAFGTAMRLCVSLSRGVAAPLGCVIFFASVEIAACTPCSRCFFRFSRRSSLCCSCKSCVSARSLSARSCSRVFGFSILLIRYNNLRKLKRA